MFLTLVSVATTWPLLCFLWTPVVYGLPSDDGNIGSIRRQGYGSNGQGGAAPAPYKLIKPLLDTPWTNDVGTEPWPQHPRPQMYRDSWTTLNGIWNFQVSNSSADVDNPPFGQALAQEVLVPSCVEGGISGIMRDDIRRMWYAKSFYFPPEWSEANHKRVLLNFEAVDYEATVFVNGQKVGFNRGGYFRFTFDITDVLKRDEPNELLVYVYDPTDEVGTYTPHGKQTLTRSHIFYVPCSGIWQSVWLEGVSDNYISNLDIAAGADGKVTVTVNSNTGESSPVEISVLEGGKKITGHEADSDQEFTFTVDSPKLWSPDSPTLYDISVKLGDDTVKSYTGFRTISKAIVNGVQRPLLNGKFVFQFGTLDQGYWPDGIYLPPTLEAMVYDLELLKSVGMNMVRKHIKIEPALFYYECDKRGLFVIQDMPSMRPAESRGADMPTPEQQAEFERQLEIMITQLKHFPSIVTWVIYNEGWGQLKDRFPEFEITDRIRELDPSGRLVDAVSGWFDHGAGDFLDNHHYASPQCGTPWYSILSSPYNDVARNRIALQGEFGGTGHIPPKENLWPVQQAVDQIDQTYELCADLDSYNYRTHQLLSELIDQVELFSCSGGVWTQTTDVEGEVNGLVTYDRRLVRVNETLWKADIQAMYLAAAGRS